MNPSFKNNTSFFSVLIFFFILLTGIIFSPSLHAIGDSYLDKGHSIFFPQKLGAPLEAYQNFPVTWWNFLIFKMKKGEQDWGNAQQLCEHLKKTGQNLVSKIECQQDLKDYLPLLEDWSKDLPLRQDRPSDEELIAAMNQTLAKASLPIDKALRMHLQSDPLESDKVFRNMASQHLRLNLERKNSFFYDANSQNILIPLQFSFAPNNAEQSAEFYKILKQECEKTNNCEQWVLIGPHASTYENKNQILKDVNIVSNVGLLIMAVFCLFLLLTKRFKLLFIFPPVLFSVFIAAIITVYFYGSIHGLVLAFGSGLVGISYDYGSHSALNAEIKSIWSANWFGYLTTVAVLAVLMCSQIPLLRQMMFFSIAGLSIAFLLLLLLHRYFPTYAQAKPFSIFPQTRTWKMLLVYLSCAGLLFCWKISLSFDMSGFDFQNPQQKQTRDWLFKNLKSQVPLFEIHQFSENNFSSNTVLSEMSQRKEWAQSKKIQVENAATFIPSAELQEKHLNTWRAACTKDFEKKLSPETKIFFQPFLQNISCEALQSKNLNIAPYPKYVSDFNFKKDWISFWLPKDENETQKIQQEFPQAFSLKALANTFPTVLIKELMWMGPLSFAFVTFLLFFYFKNLKFTLIALIPFVTGLGLISWYYFVFRLEFSFISLIALIMIYGMSVDFGIFSSDTYRHFGEKKEVAGVWTALLMAASTTLAGFIPLVFCKHQVLIDLGRTLTLGMIGTIMGTFWGVPFVLKKIKSGTTLDDKAETTRQSREMGL